MISFPGKDRRRQMARITTYEERLSDLEQIVVRQADRIAALEHQLDVTRAIAVRKLQGEFRKVEDEAA